MSTMTNSDMELSEKDHLEQKPEKEEFYNSYEELFLDAVRFSELENLEICFNNKVNYKTIDENLNNFLHLLSANGNHNIYKIIKEKVDVATLKELAKNKNKGGNLPLHWCAFYFGEPDMLKEILDLTDFIEEKNENGDTAMDLAIQFNNANAIKEISNYIQKNPQKIDNNPENMETVNDKTEETDIFDYKEEDNKNNN